MRCISTVLGIAISFSVGCGGAKSASTAPASDDATLSLDGADTSEVEAQGSSLTAALTLPTSGIELSDANAFYTPDQVSAAAPATSAYFEPASCLSVNAQGAMITYAFNDCSGPWGLSHVSGTLVAKYTSQTTATGPALSIDVTGTGLVLHRATVDVHATAMLSGARGQRQLAWSATLAGTTARGAPFSRNVSWTIAYDLGDSCVSLNGGGTGDARGRAITTSVTGYTRCRAQCPQAGGEVKITDASSGRFVEVDFLGGATATFRDATGAVHEIELACY